MNPTPKILKKASIQGRRTPWSVCLVLSLFASVLTVEAGTLYWQGNGNTTATRQWNTAANWTENATGGGLPNRVPVASAPYDDLVIGNYNATEAVLNTRPTAGKFYANSITFSCNGWLVVNVNSTNDLVVIGAGSGGTRAARFAATKYGARVAVVELPFGFVPGDDVGGAGGT